MHEINSELLSLFYPISMGIYDSLPFWAIWHGILWVVATILPHENGYYFYQLLKLFCPLVSDFSFNFDVKLIQYCYCNFHQISVVLILINEYIVLTQIIGSIDNGSAVRANHLPRKSSLVTLILAVDSDTFHASINFSFIYVINNRICNCAAEISHTSVYMYIQITTWNIDKPHRINIFYEIINILYGQYSAYLYSYLVLTNKYKLWHVFYSKKLDKQFTLTKCQFVSTVPPVIARICWRWPNYPSYRIVNLLPECHDLFSWQYTWERCPESRTCEVSCTRACNTQWQPLPAPNCDRSVGASPYIHCAFSSLRAGRRSYELRLMESRVLRLMEPRESRFMESWELRLMESWDLR